LLEGRKPDPILFRLILVVFDETNTVVRKFWKLHRRNLFKLDILLTSPVFSFMTEANIYIIKHSHIQSTTGRGVSPRGGVCLLLRRWPDGLGEESRSSHCDQLVALDFGSSRFSKLLFSNLDTKIRAQSILDPKIHYCVNRLPIGYNNSILPLTRAYRCRNFEPKLRQGLWRIWEKKKSVKIHDRT